jgi:hypothetical protein
MEALNRNPEAQASGQPLSDRVLSRVPVRDALLPLAKDGSQNLATTMWPGWLARAAFVFGTWELALSLQLSALIFVSGIA